SQTTCSNKIRLEYGGVQVGQDFAKLNLGGSDLNLHFGASAGYAEGKLKDLGTNFGGGNVQAAFVGPYSVLTYGNFVADISARFNLYRFDISVPNSNISNRQVDATGYSVSSSAGYVINIGSWYFVPSASINHSVTNVDDANLTDIFGSGLGADARAIATDK